jgi:predicted PurR-regulated permease PerM
MDGSVFIAYDYPLLGAFWTVMWIFLWALWLVMLFRVVTDIFRDHELSGAAKSGWLLFVIVLPFLGVFVYLIARGSGMERRDRRKAERRGEELDSHLQGFGREEARRSVDELTAISEMKARGELSQEEFERAKEKILR